MLSPIDSIIFPDRCEVLEIIPSQRYVYPIFKNGSSSLEFARRDHNWKILFNQQLQKLASVDIFIREPNSRLLSGINTFVHQTARDNPDLDRNTILWFAENFLYLNRHYCPQFYWLLNLAKYINKNCVINLLGMDSINQIANRKYQPRDNGVPYPEIISVIEDSSSFKHLAFDKTLFECIGKSMSFGDLVSLIKNNNPVEFDQAISKSKLLIDVLS